MDRRVEGTYTSKEETVSAVERLINEGYASDEIVIVTNEKHEKELEDLTLVEVDAVNPTEGLSLWEKLKESFSFGRYNSDEISNPLEEYGVEGDIGEHYTEALESGEIVILVNSAGPSKIQQLSQVNEEVLNGNNESEREVIAAKNPAKAPTKEKMDAMPGEEEQFDPTKAQSSREDIEGNPDTSPDKQNINSTSEESISPINSNQEQNGSTVSSVNEKVKGSSLEKEPELTGDESTVVAENEGHVYPDNISQGVVDGGDSSSSKGIGKTEESKPEMNTKQPESDAYYSDNYEEAGGKTIKKDDEDK
ncbi:general stress protein [Carnobacterium sp.]|uniref:general stress protein n=1 Tax=Carnobacterium sp. TaxID=48221 RepID=UPI00388D468B